MRWRQPVSLATAGSVLAALLTWALPAPVEAQEYLVRNHTQAHGVPGGVVRSIDQCPDGQIWIGTASGLARHDGAGWHRPEVSAAMSWLDYLCVKCLPDGRVVALTPHPEAVLAIREAGRWSTFDGPTELAWALHQGATQIAAANVGGQVRVLVAAGEAGGFFWDGSWHRLSAAAGVPGERINGVVALGDAFWIATSAGLIRLGREGVDTSPSALLPLHARSLRGITATQSATGDPPTLWLATADAIARLRGGVFEMVVPLPPALTFTQTPVRLAPDGHGGMLAATHHALYLIDLGSGGAERLGTLTGLVNAGANDILCDREGLLWLAGDRGVSTIISRRFASFRQKQGLLEDEVTAIAEPRPGVLVLGHGSGVSVWQEGSIRTHTFPPQPPGAERSQRVQDLEIDGHGGVWIGAAYQGVGYLHPTRGLSWPFAGESMGMLTSVRRTSRGLFASSSRGLFALQGDRIRNIPVAPVSGIRRLVARADGGLLLLTGGYGVWSWDPHTGVRQLTRSVPPPGDNVFAVWEPRPGTLWVGSRAGLGIIERGVPVALPSPDLHFDRPVYAILPDRSGHVWLGTDGGVMRWDGSHTTRFTPAEGLAGWEANRAAFLEDSAGRIWLGTDSGVSRYHPEADHPATTPPLLAIRSIEWRDTVRPADQPTSIPYGVRTVSFTWRAISFADESGLRLSVLLEGFDRAWSPDLPSNQRSVRYTNLPPGRYRLLLRAANVAGLWSETAASAEITITPPPWRTWWFTLLASLAVAGAVALTVRTAVRWRYARHLEQEVAERTAELADSETRYRRLFDDDAVARLLVDPASRTVVEANHVAARLCARGEPIATGTHVSELGLPLLDALLDSGQSAAVGASMQGRFCTSAGEERTVEAWAAALMLGGAPRLLVTLRDITERQRLQEEHIRTDKLESLGVLAGGLAHDFNNILAAALGNVSLARLRLSTEHPSGAFLQGAESSLLRAQRLTGQLLAFARGGAPIRRLTQVDALLAEAAHFVLAGSPSALRVDIAPDLWPAEVDEGQLAQAINNLVLNADQAMPSGGLITLRAHNLHVSPPSPLPLPPGPYLRISVSDQGPGIPHELRTRVFEPYFTTKPGGTGLGLASVYAIATRHGGIARIEDERQGTTVALLLPARPGAQLDEVTEPEPTSRRGGHILVMDDEADIRRLYTDILRELGFEVTAAPDGETAIRLFREAIEGGRRFACVLLDLTVPGGMGGRETLRRLRELDPEVQAIVASGYSTEQVLANHEAEGFAAALTKPFTISQLQQTIEKVLASAHPQGSQEPPRPPG